MNAAYGDKYGRMWRPDPKHWTTSSILILFLVILSHYAFATDRKSDNDSKIFVPGERPFDAVNIFGDLGRSIRPSNTLENKIWWERMIRGEVGKDRFLILCALKDGNWKSLGDIRTSVEFQSRESYPADRLQKMLVLMSMWPSDRHPYRHRKELPAGEGWLEKNPEASLNGITTEWRIAPSVLPLLYFLLMSCPNDDRCG